MGTFLSVIRGIGSRSDGGSRRRRRFTPAVVEAVGWACPAVAPIPPRESWQAPAIVEPLEPRTHLSTTFNAYVVGGATGAHGPPATYAVNLYTTGGQASKWVVNWGDGTTPDTFLASNYRNGVFPTPFSPSHQYASPASYTIIATATPVSGSAVTATFALNSVFVGNSANRGTTVYNPSGNTGNGAGRAIAIDTSGGTYNGYIYCLSSYGAYASVSRFTPLGVQDTSFGAYNTPGSFVLTNLGSGTPVSIAVDSSGRYVVVCGQFNGWGVAMIDTTGGLAGAGQVVWTQADLVSTGQASAIAFDKSTAPMPGTPLLFVAGSVAGVSPHLSCMALGELDLSTGCFSSGFNSGCGPVTFVPSGNTCAYATSLIDLDDSGDRNGEGLVVGGYTTYGGGSDFTLAELDDSGALIKSFGSGGIMRVNIGATMGPGNGAVNDPSYDVATGVAYDGATGDLVVCGYTNATGGTGNHEALAAVLPAGGTLDPTFGPFSDGVSVGPAGVANGLAIDGSGAIFTGGTYNNDFLACKFNPGGSIASSFGNGGNGQFGVDFGGTSANSNDNCTGIVIETDGSILLGGSTTPSGSSTGQIALADLLASPQINIT